MQGLPFRKGKRALSHGTPAYTRGGTDRHKGTTMDPLVQRTINDAIEHGALVEFYAAPDACLVCRALLGKVFDPHDAPVIPVPNCTNETCRCDYLPAARDRPPRFSRE
jgi:hypothetical protein